MLIDGRPLWLAQTNTWVVAPEPGGPAVVIDAPPDASGVLDLLARHDLTPVALLVTHGHIDHAGGAGQLLRTVSATAYVHPDDDFLTLDPISQLRMLFGMVPPGDYEPPERFTALADGDRRTVRHAGDDLRRPDRPGPRPRARHRHADGAC